MGSKGTSFSAHDWNGDSLSAFVDAERQLSIDLFDAGQTKVAANVELSLDQAEEFAKWIQKEVGRARSTQ